MLTVEKVLLLKGVGYFRELPGEVLAAVAGLCEEVEAAPGQTVVAEGEHEDSLYVVASGRVQVRSHDKMLTQLGVQEAFGELAALDPGERTATVSALEECLLLKLSHEDLYDLMAAHAGLHENIIRELSRRYRKALLELNRNACEDAKQA